MPGLFEESLALTQGIGRNLDNLWWERADLNLLLGIGRRVRIGGSGGLLRLGLELGILLRLGP